MAIHTTASADLSPEMKVFYDRALLRRTVPTLVHSNFAQKRTIPRNGGKTIEFRRFAPLATAPTPLTEGTPPTPKDLAVTAITATIDQYGDVVSFTDLVSTVTIDPILAETTKILAEQAAQTIDEVMRDVLVTGTQVRYASGVANRAAVAANITVDDLRLSILDLKLGRAPKISGGYVALIHPAVSHDLMGTTEWVQANNENQTGRVFSGEMGRLYGVRFIESDVCKVFSGAGAGGVDVYATLLFGQEAWGMVNLAGHNLRTFYKALGSAGTADPIDQQQTMGWKVAFVAKILTNEFMVRLETAANQ